MATCSGGDATQYFSAVTDGSVAAQKAAAIGLLLADGFKGGFLSSQQAELHCLQHLAHGNAPFDVDLLACSQTRKPRAAGD